jgi:hypothetical protein
MLQGHSEAATALDQLDQMWPALIIWLLNQQALQQIMQQGKIRACHPPHLL